jgi:serine/threonine-protein kinase
VAIKFLAPDPKYIDVTAFDDVAERFRREGQRGEHLNHQHLVSILGYEENEDGHCFRDRAVKNPFLVMQFVRGATLEKTIRNLGSERPLGIHVSPQTLSLGRAVVDALVHLHERKLVHRDVKPANIFVSTPRVGVVPSEIKLGDFGVTKWGDFVAVAVTGTLTTSSQRGLGTLKYMSPEQALKPKDVTVRSDMFSLGITLFELFTGTILASPHHVFEIMTARRMRSSITGKLLALGIRCTTRFEESVFEKVLDLFLVAKERPTSLEMLGRFDYWLDRVGALDSW